ncbi:MAG TPA: metal ABC transporter substrate-binding protein [Burkholderiales bacterium]|nr:metal ABC transporter substrate-binding protein [Burkholderiales bacterium]
MKNLWTRLSSLAQVVIAIAAWIALAGVAHAQARLPIVATTTDLKSLAEAVGGDRVSVVALVPPNTDAEEYQPKPHDLNRLKDARLVLRVGVDYDLWLDRLVQQSGNREIARGGSGYVDCSFGIALLDVRGAQVGPSGGHAHGSGNPHYWLDPANAEMITAVIVEALARNDPRNAEYYGTQRARFLGRLADRVRQWEKTLAVAHGRPLLAYHNTWAYFARRFRLNFAGYIEPRPGVPPSPSQVAALIRIAQSQRVSVIVRQPHEPVASVDFVSAKSGARVVILASSVGAVPPASDYVGLLDYNVRTLAAAFREGL